LRDDTGECLVDPEHAEIMTWRRQQWQKDKHRYTEWMLLEHDTIRVLGQFRTTGGPALDFDKRAVLSDLLSEWKRDMPALLRRFDRDRDGRLSLEEWEPVRQAAVAEVEQTMRAAQATPDISLIAKPADQDFFLISNLSRESLSRRYLLWSWVHVLTFIGSLCGTGWVQRYFVG
jgi:hypothetical protein